MKPGGQFQNERKKKLLTKLVKPINGTSFTEVVGGSMFEDYNPRRHCATDWQVLARQPA